MIKKSVLLVVFSCLLFLSCSESSEADIVKENVNISYELLEFEYIPQVGTQEDRLRYKIKFINNSTLNVQGIPRITLNSDGMEYSTIPAGTFECTSIPAKSFCIYHFDKTDNNPLVWALNVKFVKAEYLIKN
jgi:hypothetical protein